MKSRRGTPRGNLTPAIEAINNLTARELSECFDGGQHAALNAYSEIELAPIIRKSGIFYGHLVPSRNNLVLALANAYRRYFKLALAYPREVGSHPNDWVIQAIQPAIIAALEWLRDWYILACDGENQSVRREGRIDFVPGQTVSIAIPTAVSPFSPSKSWRAPAWLFEVSPTLGILLLRSEHVPANDSEEKLGAAHTRLLLRAARRSFLWQLDAAIETVRNEEVAAAGAIPAETVNAQVRKPNRREGWEQKQKLYTAIQSVLNRDPSLEGIDFCAELDKRHAPPLYDWTKHGQWQEWFTWKKAWHDAGLRKKIRRVRQEAMKRR